MSNDQDTDGLIHCQSPEMARSGYYHLTLRLSQLWALFGGAVLFGVVLVNVGSVAGTAVIALPIPGDLELTEIGIGITVFAFLPYCQMTGANVTADIFTTRASDFWLSVFSAVASLVALFWALLLLWRMWSGMTDQRTYGYTTTILEIPIWLGFVPCLVSLALLAMASFATLMRGSPEQG